MKCLNCARLSCPFFLSWRPCWLCSSLINPCAPRNSAAHGESIVVEREGIERKLIGYAHTSCLDLHSALVNRTGLSKITRMP